MKEIKSRIILKHDIEENWNKAQNFIPKQGEIIIYDTDDNFTYSRMKIGDGITNVIDLPFSNQSAGQQEQVQSDWNINDENATGYIKNKPFYEDSTESTTYYVDNQSITIPDSQYLNDQLPDISALILGEEYTVIFDDQEYNCIVRKDDYNNNYLGNQSIVTEFGATFPETIVSDEPFFIMYIGSMNAIYASVGDHTVTIYKKEIVSDIKKLDKKFIPNIGVDWEENDESAAGYINNKPFYEFEEEKEVIFDTTTIDFSNCYSVDWGQTKVGYIYEGYILSSLVADQKYNVIFDGVIYSCTSTIENEYGNIIIGNGAHIGNSNEDNGLPFAIGIYNHGDTYAYIISPDQESHTIKISIPGTSIKKLDKKFIPNLGIDWNENDKDSSKYISNRPFYEYYDGEPIYAIDNSIIAFSRGRATNQISTQHRLIEGETYIVIFDDKEYSCVARRINEQYDSLYLGSQQVVSTFTDFSKTIISDEPFYCTDYGSTYDFFIHDQNNCVHTMTIYTGLTLKQKQIEEKFIPNTIARVSDIKNFEGTIKLNQLVLIDSVNGYEYKLEMKNGTLVSSLAITSIEVTANPTQMFYENGDDFNPEGMIIKANYSDGTFIEITNYTCSKVNNNIVTITYEENQIKYTTKLEVQTIEILLKDFEYTRDGNTFTLTGWKQTLNGEPSTELIIPEVPEKYKIIV